MNKEEQQFLYDFIRASSKNRFVQVTELRENDSTLLHQLINKPQLLIAIVKVLLPEQRWLALQVQNRAGKNIFHLCYDDVDLVKNLLTLLPQSDRLTAVVAAEGKSSINSNSLQPYVVEWDIFDPEEKKYKPIESTSEDFYENPLIIRAARRPFLLKIILSLLTDEQRLCVLNYKENDNTTILHHAALYPESLKSLLLLYSSVHRFNAINFANQKGNTPLYSAIINKHSFEIIYQSLSSKEQFEIWHFINIDTGDTLLHRVANKPSLLKYYLQLIPHKLQEKLLKISNKAGNNLLHLVTYDLELFQYIFSLFSSNQDAMNALNHQNNLGDTALHIAAQGSPEVFKFILLAHAPENYFKVLTQSNRVLGYYVIQKIAYRPELLEFVLKHLTPAQQIELLTLSSRNKTTFLHHIMRHPQSLKVLERYYTPSVLLKACQQIAASYKTTVLHVAANKSESLEFVLNLYPIEERLLAIQIMDETGNMVIHKACANAGSLQVLLKLLPSSQRYPICKLVNKGGQSVLDIVLDFYVINKEKSTFDVILDCLTDEEQKEVMKWWEQKTELTQKEYKGESVLSEQGLLSMLGLFKTLQSSSLSGDQMPCLIETHINYEKGCNT